MPTLLIAICVLRIDPDLSTALPTEFLVFLLYSFKNKLKSLALNAVVGRVRAVIVQRPPFGK